MRVLFEFSHEEKLNGPEAEFWINKFPFQLKEGDMIGLSIVPESIIEKLNLQGADSPKISCLRYDKDINGYYLHVYFEKYNLL